MRYLSYLIIIASLLISCSPNNVKKDNSLKKFFDENKTDGTFALLDNGTGKFTVYNLSRYRDSAYVPASTFKIINSLIGLQTGAISSDSMIIKWDGIKRRDTWDKDLTMYEAFRVSAVPYYQEVARRIGKDTMQAWLNRLGYGAKSDTDKVVITSAIDTFWLDNSVTVTPDQQLGIMKELYFNRLPGFFRSHQETVKNAMLFENNTNYELGYKTGGSGWDSTKGRYIAWVVGWIKENNHPYFFVLNFETKERNADIPAIRMNMLKGILKHLGFFEGKM
jgi:beta-lactamase class D